MHHAFDDWMRRNYPGIKFERYADDIVVHCSSKKEAEKVLEEIKVRLKECKLSVHPEKTKIVYCKDEKRKETHENESFDFLGYTFRPRVVVNKQGKRFVGYTPAISNGAAKSIREEIRSWEIPLRSDKSLSDLARMFNKQVQGWINYYGRYCKSAMNSIMHYIKWKLICWAMRKYKRFKGHQRKASTWLKGIREREPGLFAHWKLGFGSQVG
jgi:RNA-directed DNA polymerase